MSTVFCNVCSVQLSYPTGSMQIQCPQCFNIMNPQAPQQTQCIGCSTMLTHPASTLYFQCPNCFTVMNAGDSNNRQQQQQPQVKTIHEGTYPPPVQQQMMMSPDQHAANLAANRLKAKKKRDPRAPKAASNAYMIFCKEMRPRLKEESNELTFGKLGAKLGEMWRNLPTDEKKPYEDMAAADRERYRKEMEAYQTHGVYDEPSLKRSKSDASDDEDRFDESFGSHPEMHHSYDLSSAASSSMMYSHPHAQSHDQHRLLGSFDQQLHQPHPGLEPHLSGAPEGTMLDSNAGDIRSEGISTEAPVSKSTVDHSLSQNVAETGLVQPTGDSFVHDSASFW